MAVAAHRACRLCLPAFFRRCFVVGGMLGKKNNKQLSNHHEMTAQTTPAGSKNHRDTRLNVPDDLAKIKKFKIHEMFLVTTYYNIALDL